MGFASARADGSSSSTFVFQFCFSTQLDRTLLISCNCLFLLYLYSAFGSSTTECFRRAKRKAQKRYMPFMKLSSTLTIILMLLAQSSVLGQGEGASKHQFSFYINEKEKSSADAEIFIVVSEDTIKGNYVEGFYHFPPIDTSKQFDIIVKVSDIIFSGQGYPGWMLNKGSRITFVKLTKLKKLTSVAEYNGMSNKDEGWEWYSKRFFVVNHTYTIDIDNRNKIKELQFLVISPNSSGKLVTTKKVVK